MCCNFDKRSTVYAICVFAVERTQIACQSKAKAKLSIEAPTEPLLLFRVTKLYPPYNRSSTHS